MLRWLGWLGIACVSCAHTSVDFSPYSAASVKAALTDRALFAFPGDVAQLHAVGGELLGTLAIDGNAFATRDDLRERALDEAATMGGTHVFISGEEANTNWAKVSNDRMVTRVSGNTATTIFRPGLAVPITTRHGTFVVVRVRVERWSELPRALRPQPNDHAQQRLLANLDSATNDTATNDKPDNAAAETTANWYCQALDDAEQCFREKAACPTVDKDIPCDDEAQAYCFAATGVAASETAEPSHAGDLRCYATIAGCRSARDRAFASGSQIVNECTESQ